MITIVEIYCMYCTDITNEFRILNYQQSFEFLCTFLYSIASTALTCTSCICSYEKDSIERKMYTMLYSVLLVENSISTTEAEG
jgi:hypothetical protein